MKSDITDTICSDLEGRGFRLVLRERDRRGAYLTFAAEDRGGIEVSVEGDPDCIYLQILRDRPTASVRGYNDDLGNPQKVHIHQALAILGLDADEREALRRIRASVDTPGFALAIWSDLLGLLDRNWKSLSLRIPEIFAFGRM